MTKCLLGERNLTEQDKSFIQENYFKMEIGEMSQAIGVKKEKIKYYMRKNRLKAFVKQKLTEEQKEYILKNYSTTKNTDICNILNIDIKDLRIFAQNKKLIKNDEYKETFRDKSNGLTKYQKEFIIQNYATMNSNEICKKLNIEYKHLKGYANNQKLIKEKSNIEKSLEKETLHSFLGNNIEPKEDLSKYRFFKYELNIDYFKSIDNEYKAYWLGFLYADGYNSYSKDNGGSNMLELGLSSVDRDHLKKFLFSIQCNSPIKNKESFVNGKLYSSSKISICNKNFCEHLHNKGCVKNKSLILNFPTEEIVPKHLIRHFIRGYFDGDGCIHVNEENSSYVVNFVGTKELLQSIASIFKEDIGLNEVKMSRTGKASQISWGGKLSCMKIFDYLYKDSNIFLDRKFNKFNSFICLD